MTNQVFNICARLARLCVLAVSVSLLIPPQLHAKPKYVIAIHGGAGTILEENLTTEQRAEYEGKLNEALDAGYQVLENAGSSTDAVIAAIKILENSPLFNAGKGAVYTFDEKHELDASIMDGETLNAGAVAGVQTVKNPILLAHAVMHESPHVMLSGEGADAFAATQKLEQVPNNYFDTEKRYQDLIKAKQKLKAMQKPDVQAINLDHFDYKFGTVGAVALDQHGNLASGTSTGGMTAKRFGRVGDSPIIGAGTYANNASCAVSATGHGEYFIRYNVAADICARVQYQGKPVTQAAQEVIFQVLEPAGGQGGVIVISAQGDVAMPFNTAGMYRGFRDSTGNRSVKIFAE